MLTAARRSAAQRFILTPQKRNRADAALLSGRVSLVRGLRVPLRRPAAGDGRLSRVPAPTVRAPPILVAGCPPGRRNCHPDQSFDIPQERRLVGPAERYGDAVRAG